MAHPVSAQTERAPFSDLDENASLDSSSIDSSHDNGSSTGESYVQYSSQMLRTSPSLSTQVEQSLGSRELEGPLSLFTSNHCTNFNLTYTLSSASSR